MMYPLKFKPILKEKIWGGTRLKKLLGKPIESSNTGESWELSGVPGDVSVVANGPYTGTSLQQLIDEQGEQLLGKRVLLRFGNEFPLLIKFIDANEDLSIQLHPGDELARRRHNSMGKTEMWYVMEAEKGAQLIVGFNREVDRETYERSLEEDRLPELLNYETVEEGDTFFINKGKIHAIGAGILLAEIQQNSDVTYRVFDFKRSDKDGKPRELHTELALDAIDYQYKQDFKIDYPRETGKLNPMVRCPYFKTDFLTLDGDFHRDISERDSFTVLMCVSGTAEVGNMEGSVNIKKGETVLMPASSTSININTSGAKFLEVTL